MSPICRVRALVGPCRCAWCAFGRMVDEYLRDDELRQRAEAYRIPTRVYR